MMPQLLLPSQTGVPILKCGEGILQLVKELYQDIQAVPILITPLTKLIGEILTKFSDSCTEKVNSILKGTRTEKRLAKPAVAEHFQSNLLWKKQQDSRIRSLHRRSGSLGRVGSMRVMKEVRASDLCIRILIRATRNQKRIKVHPGLLKNLK